ncbi:hypothetical protein BC834DRAFT_493890 [Gloeopeniophorella convolvens]|nr:hypothetical protein BC834DRAFT_493890 [Gloeopeniophorella convolvens]
MLCNALLLLILSVLLASAKGDGDGDKDATPTTTSSSHTSSSIYSSYTPTTTSSGPQLQLDSPANTTTCGQTTIAWDFQGAGDVPLTVQITDAFASQMSFEPGNVRLMVTFRTLTTNVPSTASQLTWGPVDVDEGFYTAVAFDTQHSLGVYAQSSPFFVESGDRSCLDDAASSPSNSTSSSSSSSSTSNTGLPPPTASPGVRSSSKGINPRVLAGTIAGIVVGIIVIIAAFTAPRLFRRHLPTRNRRPGAPYYLF